MRALDCECSRHLEGDNDEELLQKACGHVELDHPDMGLGEEQIRGLAKQGAYGRNEKAVGSYESLRPKEITNDSARRRRSRPGCA